jgi:hypothetical protein
VPRIYFTDLTQRVAPGGRIRGTLVVESDKPMDPTDIRVDLVGAEIAFVEARAGGRTGVSFGSGPSNRSAPLQDRRPFLDVSQIWDGTGQISGTTFRLPFSFDLPLGALATLRTGELRLGGHGEFEVLMPPRFGMFVEYSLKGRVVHPHWIDTVELRSIAVAPPEGPLGALAPLRADSEDGSATLLVTPDSAVAVPGGSVEGSYQVLNPKEAKFEKLSVAVLRTISYSALGVPHVLEVPRYEQIIEIPREESAIAGRFSIPIPQDLDALPAFQGSIFQTNWSFAASLQGGFLTKPIVAQNLLTPPLPPPPPSPS